MKITRGFSQKTNLGNYESFDTWSSWEEEIESIDAMEISYISNYLYQQAKADVELAIKNFKEELELKKKEEKKQPF